jgi:hypothetical protein
MNGEGTKYNTVCWTFCVRDNIKVQDLDNTANELSKIMKGVEFSEDQKGTQLFKDTGTWLHGQLHFWYYVNVYLPLTHIHIHIMVNDVEFLLQTTGIPLDGHFRLQYNLLLQRNYKIR